MMGYILTGRTKTEIKNASSKFVVACVVGVYRYGISFPMDVRCWNVFGVDGVEFG